MNSASSVRDMATMIHEGGHAIHSFLSQPLKITAFKNFPSEIAELASMSMELITLDYWDTFIKDTEELKRAKRYHLEKTISILPWIAAVDSFQHWIYENPNHTQDERETEWVKIIKSFNGEVVDWSNYPEVQANLWHKQLHIFEVPFYYIEYAIAQLGAIAVWKNYKQNPESALKAFEKALSAGNTLTLPELYALSGIKFSFERSYIDELMQFILKELNEIV
jgi:oligoendopeptidase F